MHCTYGSDFPHSHLPVAVRFLRHPLPYTQVMLLASPFVAAGLDAAPPPQVTTDHSDSLAQLQELLMQVSPSIGTSFGIIGTIGTAGNVAIGIIDVSIGNTAHITPLHAAGTG